jgi:hypothetical protein
MPLFVIYLYVVDWVETYSFITYKSQPLRPTPCSSLLLREIEPGLAVQPAESLLFELRSTLLSYAAHYLSYAAPYLVTPHPLELRHTLFELRRTLLSYVAHLKGIHKIEIFLASNLKFVIFLC